MAVRLVFIVAFCVMIVGAAGFSKEIEPLAWPLYLGGLAVTLVSGFALRKANQRSTAAAAVGSTSLASLVNAVEVIRDEVAALEASAATGDAKALLVRLDAVLARCASLGERNEDYMKSLGIKRYVQVWDGFATAERLLARAWSMTADGFADEGRRELPRARAALERAASAR